MKQILIKFTALAAFFLASAGMQPATAQQKGGVKTLSTKEFNEKVYDINKETLKYLGSKPAIVDFYADWCGPCQMISPTLTAIAAEYAGKIVVYKVDVDKAPEIAQAFGIRSIPAVLYIPMQGQPRMTLGARDKAKFIQEIKAYLLKQ